VKSDYEIRSSPNYDFYKCIVRISEKKVLCGWSKDNLEDLLKELQGLEQEIYNMRVMIGLEDVNET